MGSGHLDQIEVRSGVNEDLIPFCTVVVNGGDLLGQLTLDEVRSMALDWLSVAEAAEQDAIVFRLLMKTGLSMDEAGAFVANMREARG